MKRLITILLSFIGCVSLFGQTVPMVVAGKVHVSGTMRSQGAVHLYASMDTAKVDIDNTAATAMLVTDTVILYSNDTYDGLLRNLNTNVAGGVKGITNTYPAEVIVRKNIKNQVYTYVTLPFDVGSVQKEDGTPLGQVDYNGYWAYEFDEEARADSSTVDASKVWKEVKYSKGLKKATGYMVWYEPGGNLDFVTTNQREIDTLFSSTDKKKFFRIYNSTKEDWKNPEYGNGWAFIGGLNPTTYVINRENIGDYGGSSIWYRKSNTSQSGTNNAGYKEVIIKTGESAMVGPYTPFYIQQHTQTDSTGGFIFKYKGTDGLSLESSEFRSINDNMKDQLFFALSSDKDNSFGRFYLTFADNYSESYKASEDAVTMMTYYSDQPALYCLDGANQPLALNGLPMKDERKVGVGFSIPEAGDYTFRLDALKLTDVRNVILVDNVTGKKVDLLQTPYSFNTEGVVKNENNRFALYINSSYTDIPSIDADKPYAYTKDNILTIKNLLEGDKVSVYDLAGRTVASSNVSGKEFSTVLSQKGVYVVNVKGKNGQTSVLKVLNK